MAFSFRASVPWTHGPWHQTEGRNTTYGESRYRMPAREGEVSGLWPYGTHAGDPVSGNSTAATNQSPEIQPCAESLQVSHAMFRTTRTLGTSHGNQNENKKEL